MPPIKCAIYARVSDRAAGKKRDEWDSIPRQKAALLELAARHEMEPVAIFEEAMSGAKRRPKFEEMIGLIKAGEVQAVLVATFDRLTRTEQLGEFEQIKYLLRSHKCELYTVAQGRIPIDGKADSELTTDMQATVSKFERLKIRERTLAAREATARAGKWTGHAPPYGYKMTFNPDSGERSFAIDEAKAAVVRHIFETYLSGEGPRDIALGLDRQGIDAPRGIGWNKETIKYMLRNSIYKGVSTFRKAHVLPKALKSGPIIEATSLVFPPLITAEMFDATQEAIIRRKGHHRHGPGTPHPLSGLMRCESCGGRMNYGSIYGGRYKCYTYFEKPGGCPSFNSFKASQCHEVVLAFLQKEIPKHLNRMHLKRAQAVEKSTTDETTPLRLKLEEMERARASIVLKMAQGVLSDEDAGFTLRQLRRDIEQLKSYLGEVDQDQEEAKKAEFIDLEPTLEALATFTPTDPDDDLRELFESTILQVYLKRKGKDKQDKRRYILAVSKIQLADGEWIVRG